MSFASFHVCKVTDDVLDSNGSGKFLFMSKTSKYKGAEHSQGCAEIFFGRKTILLFSALHAGLVLSRQNLQRAAYDVKQKFFRPINVTLADFTITVKRKDNMSNIILIILLDNFAFFLTNPQIRNGATR